MPHPIKKIKVKLFRKNLLLFGIILLILLLAIASAVQWINFDGLPLTITSSTPTSIPLPTPNPNELTIRGADVSSLQRALELGQKYYDANGVEQNPLDILQSIGVNYIRLRVWVNPASGYNNLSRLVEFAPQLKSRGLKLLIDLHYSDTWA